MELLVVGAGAMGRWFADTVAGTDDSVGFADADPDAATAAVDEVGGHVVDPATEESFDVVCVAVPMDAVSDAIAEHAGLASEAVLDVSGEMRDSVAALEAHATGVERASLHPLFSATNAPGNVPVVVDRDGPALQAIREALSAAGNEVFETTPAEHDRAMETVQARAHTAVLAYALAAEDVDPRFHTTLSGPLSELAEQLTGNTPAVYADIQERFDGGESVAEAARLLAAADREAFLELYEDADR